MLIPVGARGGGVGGKEDVHRVVRRHLEHDRVLVRSPAQAYEILLSLSPFLYLVTGLAESENE